MNMPPPTGFAIRDLKTGCDIVSRISLANPQQAESDLARFLDTLLIAPPDPETYFRLLEHARLPIAFVSEELSKRYQNKPLPLAEPEEHLFQRVIGLWLKLARAYAHCAERDPTDEGSPAHAYYLATLLHRCIRCTGMAIIEHQRARREYPWGLWLDLHGYYGSAEDWEVATLTVADPLDSLNRTTHCAAAYTSVLLCDMAGCYSLSVRDQLLVQRWAEYWAPLASLHPAHPGEALPQYVIDLVQDQALRVAVDCLQIDHIRRLDTQRLAQQISQMRQQLRQRASPGELGLGSDCTASVCMRLLEHLSRPWSQARAPRKFRRHASSGITQLCCGFDEMHFFILGKEFEQPENVRTYSRREFDNLFAFRHQESPIQAMEFRQEQLGYRKDPWEVVNQSVNGFRLVRSIAGRKMQHGQLIALCPHDGDRFILARTTWLMQEKGGGLIAGVEAMPGIPLAIGARPMEQPADHIAPYQRAFLLPSIPAVQSEQSLILCKGWYRRGRTIELFTDGAWQVELKDLLIDGADFDRVSFVIC